MKTKYPNLFGILAALMLVLSFVLPASLVSPAGVAADPGMCKWDTLREPGALPGSEVIANCSDAVDFAVGSDFTHLVAIVDEGAPTWPFGNATLLKWSYSKGSTWTSSKYTALGREPAWGGYSYGGFPYDRLTRQCYQIVMAPDNPDFWVVTTDGPVSGAGAGAMTGPRELWVTQTAGADWDITNLYGFLGTNETIRTVDISVDYGGKRDIAVGTATGAGGGHLFVVKSTGFSGWQVQTPPEAAIDFFAVKFSPSYASDASLAVVFADNVTGEATCAAPGAGAGATFYNVQLRDIDQNATLGWAFTTPGIEVKDTTWTKGASPSYLTLNKATLELPSDFSGQAASLRRAYISLDAMVFTASTCAFTAKGVCDKDGIFRIDDTTVYTLMDTSTVMDKSIYSIAYFGTYASGKLLAGERMGYPCSASVPTWFTDSPTTCPVPCWYPCLKCPTGAACPPVCTVTVGSKNGVGAAIVHWSPQGDLAYVITGSKAYVTGPSWWANLVTAPVCNDESAMSISRNNGETWNQISLIDTVPTKFTDIAPTPDCKTIYLASSNICQTSTTSCQVCWSANVTCYGSNLAGVGQGPGSANCTIETTSWPSATCGTFLSAADNTSTSSCSWNIDTCVCTFTFRLKGMLHCNCTTCPTCKVPFDSGTVTTTTQIASGVPSWKIFTVCANVDCTTQEGPCGNTTINPGYCCFDSVWRTSSNPDVVLPLSPVPGGVYWERVFTHVTAPDCTGTQTDKAILRLVPYCADPTGEIIAWAVYDPGQSFPHGVAAWSPDFGDYWAMLTPRNPVQDFTFESRTVMYFLSPGGLVQKMPYTGTAWASSLATVDSTLAYGAHTIAAYPEGKVLVGSNYVMNAGLYATAYSSNFNTDNPSFTIQALSGNTRQGGNIHVAFDPNFKDNGIYYIGDDSATGSVFRNSPTTPLRWSDTDMMSAMNGAVGCAPHAVGQFGIVLAFTGQALYSAHTSSASIPCGVDRTIDDGTGKYGPLSGMPKPGIAWDHLSAGFPTQAPCFTLEPSSLKICGCCTLDTDSTLYAIDNAQYWNYTKSPVAGSSGVGLIWAFTDCLAKRGPALVTADKTLIGCDPVSGRAGEVNLCWEQLCVASGYDIEIAKDNAFTIRVIDLCNENSCGCWSPSDVTAPCAYFPAGGAAMSSWGTDEGGTASAIAAWGNLECGHTYYWRVKARQCATTQVIRSPWSEVRSFNVKAGLPIVASYSGLQLLSPANGSMGIPVKSPAFSWAPLGENTKYKFQLAKDGNMTQIVKEAEVTNTAYAYDGTLDYSTPYFWKVSCVDPACDSSATFSFQTEPKPAAPSEAAPVAPTPIWVWVVIAIGAILVIVTLVLIFKTRRV